MTLRLAFVATALALLPATLAYAQRSDQDAAYEAARKGDILPLGEIMNNVRHQVGGSFLGGDFDPGSRRYRLKYMREGAVVVVDVDARTGTVLGTTGN